VLNWPVNGLALPGGRVLLEGTKGRPSYSGPATLEHAAITAGLDAGSIRSSASSCLNVKDLRLAVRTEIIHGSGVPDCRTLEYPDRGACRGDDMKPSDSPGGPWNFSENSALIHPLISYSSSLGTILQPTRDGSNSVIEIATNSGGEFDAVSAFVLRCV
jgi:hypothetical protein